ncbi:hypothetical protein RIF29_16367 [Crotalaria pallida]|uniref:Uncharacterized protein n=1 Tax=Crotalaria pallida TaxID=3830 RepID=A0AAN9IDI2_CROPI
MPAVGAIGVGNNKEYPGKLTPFVTATCVVATMGGLIFGYEIGISGILVANVLNYFFAKINGGWGWRLSLGATKFGIDGNPGDLTHWYAIELNPSHLQAFFQVTGNKGISYDDETMMAWYDYYGYA